MMEIFTMAKQTVRSKGRRRRTGGNSGYISCNVCHGTGRIKNWHKSKKKK